MTEETDVSQPFRWWGPVWSAPRERSVAELIGDGVLDVETAALLWALLARRVSLAVVAGPSGAGKTTLLTALLGLLPPDVRRIYLRGCYESFAFLDDPEIDPGRTVLLINELSAHPPSYLWGPAVRRTLDAGRAGFGLLATAHATGVDAFVSLLAAYPLGVPMVAVAAFQALVVLDCWQGTNGETRREVRAVHGLALTSEGGLVSSALSQRSARGTPAELDIGAIADLLERLDGTGACVDQTRSEMITRGRTIRRECDAAPTATGA
jgi:energy-coupling factor transporter ATP-binding protein EcfA2